MRSLIIAPLALFALVAGASAIPTTSDSDIAFYPGYDNDWDLSGAWNADEAESEPTSTSTHTLEARGKGPASHCTLQKEFIGRQKNLKRNIKYLREVRNSPARPRLEAGKCAMVACSGEGYDSTVVEWCNDSKKAKTLPGWHNIADGAQVILDQCQSPKDKVSGYLGHNDGWRVLTYAKPCYLIPGPQN
ncbi:uncharacterized protein DSM5745_10180 [Aspergillus mulundensis]|uniref:Secreted protein n=1 Tax=Aspergillus mulundensis TaxID=1810919 RepID=A0A3D8QMQ0_9EURO|nr:hypothetical protein DSM5745_10180 [Aspergillus mulundensis]RDW63069.1 hypothetical protein DSM5745_10180 [Aspergillus mulundensis]